VFVCTQADGHPDHVAVNRATRAALTRCSTAPRLLEYPVWAWATWPWSMTGTDDGRARSVASGIRAATRPALIRVRTGRYRRAKRRAIACYRSQHGLPDGGPGEGLPPTMVEAFDVPFEIFVAAGPPAA
jgi:LmbE family N-acetylglucosaminyl deacetylase